MRILAIILAFFLALPAQAQDGGYFLLNQTTATAPSNPYSLASAPWGDWDGDNVTLSGGSITSWPDASGNGRTLTLQSGAANPIYTASALNGHGVVEGDGTFRGLQCGTGLSAATAATVFIVLKINNYPPSVGTKTGHPLPRLTSGNSAHYTWLDGSIYENFGTTTRYGFGPGSDLSLYHVYAIRAQANHWQYWINGAASTPTTGNTVAFETTFKVLGYSSTDTYNFDGKIARIRVYDRALSDAEIAEEINHYNYKYNLY